MARNGLDIEEMQIELEKVADLLGIFQDFIEYECPRGSMEKIDRVAAVAFACRANTYTTAIDTARDKVFEVVESMGEFINNHFAEQLMMRKSRGTVEKC